ncbi:MAG: hypothetical protein ABSF64_01490 [Bryobacteraceae bacterium]|jgi:hypothetical protein
MLRVVIFILAAAALAGQTPPATTEKAPPPSSPNAPADVDAALRARVAQFYQFEVDGKFSRALQLVADDTKDLFIGSSKPTYQTFEIKSVQYSEDFSKAEVMLLVNRLLPIQGFMGHALPTRMTSRWKLENGLWCYYVDPQKDLPTTPFGGLPVPGMRLPAGGGAGAPLAQPPMPSHLPDPRLLTADKTSVQLKASGTSSERVTISNPSPWPETLTLSDPKLAGLTVKLDTLTVNPRQKAILSIQSSDGLQIPKTPVTIVVTVRQINQTIPIKVTFAN